jgi:hypothetical protein
VATALCYPHRYSAKGPARYEWRFFSRTAACYPDLYHPVCYRETLLRTWYGGNLYRPMLGSPNDTEESSRCGGVPNRVATVPNRTRRAVEGSWQWWQGAGATGLPAWAPKWLDGATHQWASPFQFSKIIQTVSKARIQNSKQRSSRPPKIMRCSREAELIKGSNFLVW